MRRTEVIASQADQDYSLIVGRKRKSASVYSRLAFRGVIDLGAVLARGDVPFDRDAYIYQGVKAMADYAQAESVENIVFVDKSARPLWVGVSEYWRQAYPHTDRPGFYFMNPAFFRRNIARSDSAEHLARSLADTAQQTIVQLQAVDSPLVDSMDKPILLADACMHSGKAVYVTRRVLETAGFQDVRVGVVNTTLQDNDIAAPDIYGTNNVAATRCLRSEDSSNLVANDEHSIFSMPVHDSDVLRAGSAFRAHIRTVISEHFLP